MSELVTLLQRPQDLLKLVLARNPNVGAEIGVYLGGLKDDEDAVALAWPDSRDPAMVVVKEAVLSEDDEDPLNPQEICPG